MIQIDEQNKRFHLYTDQISYLFQVEGDSVRNLYFGKAIDGADAPALLIPSFHSSFDADVRAEREEYSLWNGHYFHLPCLQVKGEAGRAVFAAYVGYEKEETEETDQLDLLLEDKTMGLSVRLRYLLHKASGIIARSGVITAGDRPLTLSRVMSGSISLPSWQ